MLYVLFFVLRGGVCLVFCGITRKFFILCVCEKINLFFFINDSIFFRVNIVFYRKDEVDTLLRVYIYFFFGAIAVEIRPILHLIKHM